MVEKCVGFYTDVHGHQFVHGPMDRRVKGNSQQVYLAAVVDGSALSGAPTTVSFRSWRSGKCPRVACSSSACRLQPTAKNKWFCDVSLERSFR